MGKAKLLLHRQEMYKEPENLVIQESKETQSPGTNLKGLPLVKDEKFGLQKKKESYND